MTEKEKDIELGEVQILKKSYENVREAMNDGFQWKDLRVYVGTLAIALEECGIFLKKAGPEKKKLLVSMINKLINIPFIPESTESWIFNLVVGFFIDSIVTKFKKKGWHLDYIK